MHEIIHMIEEIGFLSAMILFFVLALIGSIRIVEIIEEEKHEK